MPDTYRVNKPSNMLPDYMADVGNGAEHPLRIETENYIKVMVGIIRMDQSFNDLNHYDQRPTPKNELSAEEVDFVNQFSKRPEVEWAMHNSFDGLYITKEYDHSDLTMVFRFDAYMKSEHVTFWRLKYSGDIIR